MSSDLSIARKGLLKPDGSQVNPDTGVRRFKATLQECRNIAAEGVDPVYQRENPVVVMAPYNLDALCRELVERKLVDGTKRWLVLEMVADNDPTIPLQTVYDGDFEGFMQGMARKVKSPPEAMQELHRLIVQLGQFSVLSHALVTLGFKDPLDGPAKVAGFAFNNIHLNPTADDVRLVSETAKNCATAFQDQLEKGGTPPDKEIIRP